jgi:hypothetical protein
LGNASENADLFKVDDQEINAEFAQLNELEQFVEANEGITLSEINSNNPLVQNVINPSNLEIDNNFARNDGPWGIPSVFWGFCPTFVPYAGCFLGIGGVLAVYFTLEDKDETKKSLIGYASAIAVQVAFVAVYVFALGNSYLFF